MIKEIKQIKSNKIMSSSSGSSVEYQNSICSPRISGQKPAVIAIPMIPMIPMGKI